ncbi:hypothetical protein SGFS_001590 [Streptomyces graminofaciens]|uniref:Uncharacterized protein n=1 Tax=Streptomyces graminofaciens TaxID=68212 RepID=A0ABN5V6B7_9ACTN|nr:hypothetical protein SGFS_001590 [Streptomyces graminofaciens]
MERVLIRLLRFQPQVLAHGRELVSLHHMECTGHGFTKSSASDRRRRRHRIMMTLVCPSALGVWVKAPWTAERRAAGRAQAGVAETSPSGSEG